MKTAYGNLLSVLLGIALGVSGTLLYPAKVVKKTEDKVVVAQIEGVPIAVPTILELPKPKHRVPIYPKSYCSDIKDLDKSSFRDNSIIKMGWTKLQVDTLFKQCKV